MMSKQHHIAFVNTSRFWGGGEKWHFDTAVHCHQQGERVTVICAPGSEMEKAATAQHLPVSHLTVKSLSFLNPLKLTRLVARLKSLHIDSLVFNSPREMKLVAPAATMAGIPKVVFRRGLPNPISGHFFHRMLFHRCVTHVIANSKEIAASLNRHHKRLVPVDNIHVIYNGLDLERFDSKGGQPLIQRQADEVILGTAGRLVKQKNQEVLLEAMQRLKAEGLSVRLVAAGLGPLEAQLNQQAKELGVDQQVDYVGYVDNIGDLLASCDIFVFPSLYEGSAHVLLEAAAFSLPVVAFDISSNPELVVHGKTGFLAPANDLDTLCHQITVLAQDSGLRQKMGAAGRAMVAELFSEHRVNEQLRVLLTEE